MKRMMLATLLLLGLPGCEYKSQSAAPGPTPSDSPVAADIDRDNTSINVRDRKGTAKTPIDQKENRKDITITADIRKRVIATKMSVNAHNVKIITQDGRVTLRGPVKTAEEKKQIEDIAVQVAGDGNVDNQLEVEATR